ncbi:DUF4349 domain-containing protein [Soonwooa sp.]|uniref:DUF4349 domain-containing protein n=1 Tax=Soonwooa sp. TaxID=1938592 RepID=UPI002622EEC7|nr:DUF4349 domain-containing protein [Soonwooa sp.]
MKKIIAAVIILNSLVMCQKSEIQQMHDHLKTADSLISTVNDNLKNIDSVSINLDSVSIPHIIKEKEKLEKLFNDSKKSIDSLGSSIDNFKKTVDSKEIQKKIDSVSSKIKSLDDLQKLKEQAKVIYKDKQKTSKAPEQRPQQKQDVLTKSANIEVNVDNLTSARQQLSQDLSRFGGRIEAENVLSNNELQTMYLTAKVPMSQFDYFVDGVSNNLGSVKTKNIEVKGQNFVDNQMCTVQLTLVENHNVTIENKDKPENQTFSEKAGDAFGSGGKVLGNIILFLLPFWPLFLLVIIGYVVYRYKFKKKEQPIKPTEKAQEPKEKQED